MPKKPTYEELEKRVRDLERLKSENQKTILSLMKGDKAFKFFFENAPVAYQSLDNYGCLINVNQTWLDVLGYDRPEVIGKSFSEFLPTAWKSHFEDSFPRFKAVGEVFGVQFEMMKSSGESIFVEFNGTTEMDSEGNFNRTHCVFKDITDHKRTSEAFNKCESRYQDLVEFTSDWIWEVDMNSVYTYSSPKIEEILGYTQEEIIGKTPYDFMKPEEAERVRTFFENAVSEATPFDSFENYNFHKDGSVVILETSGVPIFNDQGVLVGYRGIDRDITSRRVMEKELLEEKTRLVEALLKVKTLSGLLPICSSCKKIRDDKGYWIELENYISEYSEAEFSHGICPDCIKTLYPDFDPEE